MIADFGLRISDCPGGPIWSLKSGARDLLCIAQISEQIPQNDNWLSGEELNIYAGFRIPKRRAEWRLGRWTAKRAICAFLKLEDGALPELEIRAAADGAPETFFLGERAAVSISISHCRDRGLCIAGPPGVSVGCDLEWVETRERNFAADYFTREEVESVLRAPVSKEMAETLIWSAKETALKILRKGLSRDTRSVVIRADFPEEKDAWERWTGECLETARVFHGLWRASSGFIYTLASDA
jgi:4'-phosphopantetheinyl transferase